MKKEFGSEPIYNKKFIKTKIKSYGNNVKYFHEKEIPKLGCNYICLPEI